MGNNPSAESGGTGQQQQQFPTRGGGCQRDNTAGIRHFLRNNGALGLSKAELEAMCQPSGLYQSCNWEYKQIRRLIGDGKLAARCQGTEERVNETDTECPICFLQYCAINKTKCCQAYICTECYLQVRNPKETSTACPFCNQKLSVTVAHVSEEAIRERRSEEQRVIEAQIRASTSQKQQQCPTSTTGGTGSSEQTPPGSSATLPPLSAKPRNTHFGASLEQNERVARMRKRSSSGSGDLGSSITSSAHSTTPTRDAAVSSLKSLAMTPAERQALEAEMKAQHHHPLTQRMQQEEEERRFRNQQEYINSPQYQLRQQQQQQDRLRDLHARRLLMGRSSSSQQQRTTRDWNRIVQAFESGTAGNSVQSLDDLVVLEAAIMLSSMEQSSGSRQRGGDGEDASAEGRPVSADASDENGSDENDDDFATRHARAGFPLARARGANSSFASESLLSRNHGGGGGSGSGPSHRPWMMAALMSEEEQLAMAIAASLEDVPPSSTTSTDATGGAAAAAAPAAAVVSSTDLENDAQQGEKEEQDNTTPPFSAESSATAAAPTVTLEPEESQTPSSTTTEEENTKPSGNGGGGSRDCNHNLKEPPPAAPAAASLDGSAASAESLHQETQDESSSQQQEQQPVCCTDAAEEPTKKPPAVDSSGAAAALTQTTATTTTS